MKYLAAFTYVIAAAILLTVAMPAVATTFPYDAVRKLDLDGGNCSTVVIEPGVAITAMHCVGDEMSVEGLPVKTVTLSPGKDIAVLRVPGLVCPCVSTGVRPAKGDQVIAVGFPIEHQGERVISPVARVKNVGPLKEVWPALPTPEKFLLPEYIVTDAPIINHGDSGGGLFSLQNGEWRVVGINSIGIPEPESCNPFFGCSKDIGSGFVPVDLAKNLL